MTKKPAAKRKAAVTKGAIVRSLKTKPSLKRAGKNKQSLSWLDDLDTFARLFNDPPPTTEDPNPSTLLADYRECFWSDEDIAEHKKRNGLK